MAQPPLRPPGAPGSCVHGAQDKSQNGQMPIGVPESSVPVSRSYPVPSQSCVVLFLALKEIMQPFSDALCIY